MALSWCGVSRNHKRLNQRRWRQVRRQVLDAANWRCSEGNDHYGNEVDHVVSLRTGGAEWEKTNLQVLCFFHHSIKTAKENQQRMISPERQAWRAFLIQS